MITGKKLKKTAQKSRFAQFWGVRGKSKLLAFAVLLSGALQASYVDQSPFAPRLHKIQSHTYYSIIDFADHLGWQWDWEIVGEQLSVIHRSDTVRFSTGIDFFLAPSSTIIDLSRPVERYEGDLFASAKDILRAFEPWCSYQLDFDGTKNQFRLRKKLLSIDSFELYDNKAMVELLSSDKILRAYTENNALIAEFAASTVDTSQFAIISGYGAKARWWNSGDTTFVSIVFPTDVAIVSQKRTVESSVHRSQISLDVAATLYHPLPETPLVISSPTSSVIQRIVIDPGHGGKDPGCIGPSGHLEKDVVLSIGLYLRDILNKNSTLDVLLTRDSDEFIPLKTRTKMANEYGADLFISIHANSLGDKSRRNQVRGYKIYFLSESKNEHDKLVAMRENSVIEFEESTDSNDYVQDILVDLVNNQYLLESQGFSIALSEVFERTFKKIPKLHNGVGQAGFYVLKGALMPSVLIESGFMSHPKEEKILATKEKQKFIAEQIAYAVLQFKKQFEAIAEK